MRMASTAEIAKVAGVSEGTIFKHYGKKRPIITFCYFYRL